MINITQEMISCLVFCDIPVTKMELILKDKVLKIYVRSAIKKENKNNFFGNRTDRFLGVGVLFFKNWSSLKIELDTSPGEKVVTPDEWEFDQLEDILIFDQMENRVEISGFGIRDVLWEKRIIEGSEYYGEFEEYERD